ncbi:FAD-binding oxidoreductase [Stackebrandtia nassauensis]|uniref:Berberine/berberine domain protein n=1 Tax=Stackebrandtia nassauensis (strain DSM 44728 / CIP 108903 / NRRL B-16338 / NBRC 102104 / LLR-40K-21) TaxID=446470 RepID=D3Q9Z5_STANL|nr:FAD-binding protein [Stackebrandtia nassauensis]ADD40707.1 Berberine/berberine domain protein [Stackebrandtia nassauensis DSM 44728]
MNQLNRRRLLTGTAVAGGFAAGIGVSGLGSLALADPPDKCFEPPKAVTVGKDDPRYPHLTSRGMNARFTGEPDNVHIVTTTEQVVKAVTEAVAAGKRVSVRSGGHCFEDFVDSADIETVIDLSTMTNLYFDDEKRAFAIEPGLRLSEVYRRLYLGWGVTIPAGSCVEVGVGGHILGGGYGALARRDGLVVDHLYAVEVVVVGKSGKAKAVVATREKDDPNRDLWWAHTGGGGGNFGIVTRYWLRSPNAESKDPSKLLPKPPKELLGFGLVWDWSTLDEKSYARLVRNHGEWHTANSEPGTRFAGLHSVLMLNEPSAAPIMLVGTIHGDDAENLLDEYAAAITEGVSAPPQRDESREPWLDATLAANLDETGGRSRVKCKAGYLRRGWSDEQIALTYDVLNEGQTSKDSGLAIWLVAYGGKVNDVKPNATATAQRDSVLKAIYMTGWSDPDQDKANLKRVRRLYSEIYATGGGVPAPDDDNDGSFINYADADLADEDLNTSGVAWHTLYYKDNYPRLRKAKAKWDPRDVFTHKLGIRPAD